MIDLKTQSKRVRNLRNLRNLRRIRGIVILALVIALFIIGGTTKKLNNIANNVVEAKKIEETLNIMTDKNPVKIALNEEIRMVQEESNLKNEIADESNKEAEKNKDTKIAYLTFDDGPSENVTPEILDILSQYNVKATFFVVGNSAEKNPDIVKRIHEENHGIGNHTYSHRYKHIYTNTTNFLNEIKATERVLQNILGNDFETNIIRFPGGSFEKYKNPFKKAISENGYKYYDWNSLNGDAEGKNIPKNKLVSRLKATSNGKKELIILMHDTSAKKTTVEALPEIIEHLQSQGYEFRVLN